MADGAFQKLAGNFYGKLAGTCPTGNIYSPCCNIGRSRSVMQSQLL